MRLEWSEEAAEDLETLYYYYSQWNSQGALRIYNEILDGADVLLTFPKAGKVDYRLMGKMHSYRSYVVHKNFELIYYLENEVIIYCCSMELSTESGKIDTNIMRGICSI